MSVVYIDDVILEDENMNVSEGKLVNIPDCVQYKKTLIFENNWG